MKSLKQSRIDRLERKRKREERRQKAEARITKSQKIEQTNELLKVVAAACQRKGLKKCPHGIAFSGYECFICRPDEIAKRLLEKWSPSRTFKALIYSGEGESESCLPLDIKTRTISKKLKEMQENGFWYTWRGKPVFMMPGKIKVVVLGDTVRSPGYIDPPGIPADSSLESLERVRQ